MKQPPLLAIRAVALVSALGLDWRGACAAARAGLRRAAPVFGAEGQSAVDGEEEPVIGHSAALVTHGFEGAARLLRLVTAALARLVSEQPELRRCDESTGYLLVLGPRHRHLGGAALVADAEVAADLRAAALRARGGPPSGPAGDDDVPPPAIEADPAALLASAAALAGLQGAPRVLRCVGDDDVSALVALHWAAQWLARDATLARVVLVAADTLLDPEVLSWLENTGRLKASGMPVGLEPGEACAALSLERADAAGPALGVLRGTVFAREPQPLIEGGAGTGEGTATLLADLAASHGWAAGGAAWIVSDHNGEPYRANDLALAMVRARSRCPALADGEVTVPATSFGDVGAARPLLGICTVLAAFERTYAPAEEAVVLAVGDSDRRAAALVARR